jgi:hypothetical protein
MRRRRRRRVIGGIDAAALVIFTILTSNGLRGYNICTAMVNK